MEYDKPPVNFFTDELRMMRDTLSSLKTIYDSDKDPLSKSAFTEFRKEYKAAIIKAKKTANDSFILKSNNKSRASWKIINFDRNHKKFQNKNGNISPDEFNDFFINMAENIIKTLPDSEHCATDFLKEVPKFNNSFFLEPTCEEEIRKVILNLKNSDCFDIYDLNSKIIKETIEILVKPLTELINLCFSQGIFPDVFKVTKVIPIHKKGDQSVADNYRPISIVPIFGKIIEIIFKTRLNKFFENNKLLDNSQFGFRKNCSTVLAVSRVVRGIVEGFEEGKLTTLTLCDLTKAFDCVSHDLLLEKLYFYGVRGVPLKFIQSYLHARTQQVIVNGISSEDLLVRHGVPQGSVLGPLLFIIYLNDIFHYLYPTTCICFADDSTLLESHENSSILNERVSAAEDRAEQWFTPNHLKLNREKTQKIIFSSNNNLNSGNSVKLLGIVLDDGLKWTNHIDSLCKKLSTQLYVLRKLKETLSPHLLLTTYHALFHSHLSYGVLLWGISSQSIRVFRLQKRAIRLIENAGFTDHCKPLFVKFKILPIPSLYIFHTLLEIHKNKNLYQLQSELHNYSTRSGELLRAPRYRLAISARNSLNFNLYNKLPSDLRVLHFNSFKIKIKQFLLSHCFYSIDEFMETSFY